LRAGLITILNVDINNDQWLQVSIPVGDGGLRIRSAEMLAPSAYLASAASILLLQHIHTPRQHLDARRSVGGVYGDIVDRPGQLTKPSQQTQHIQKAWDGPVAANEKNLILPRATSYVDKDRLLAAAYPHSGDWLHAPPITAVGQRLSDEATRVAVAHRLGSKACEPHTCVCGKGSGCTWGCMDYPGAEALPDNNVTVI